MKDKRILFVSSTFLLHEFTKMSVPLALVTKETELGRMKDFPCHETVVV